MPTLTVPFKKLPSVFRKYGAHARHETTSCLTQVAKRSEIIMTSATRNAPPASDNGGIGAVNYGNYLKAWSARVLSSGGSRGVLVANTRVYAPNIDYGRRAGARLPPISAITQWAVKKLGLPYKEARRAAFPIAQKIKRDGLKPRGVLHGPNTTKDLSDAMETAVGAALDRAANKLGAP